MNNLPPLLKRSFAFILKASYIGFFFLYSILLLKLLYYSDAAPEKSAALSQYSRNEEMIERMLKHEEEIPRSHFHITDKSVFRLEPEPSLCYKCHGIYPHTKDSKHLSFLNLHVGFMACEVCHVRKDFKGSDHFFVWVDIETGKKSMKAKGGYGKYDARIVPVKKTRYSNKRLDKIIDEEFQDYYADLKETRYQRENREELMEIHEYNLSKKAVPCLDCHKKAGYLNFSTLGFPRTRINQLTSSEVSRMVEQYETFYMPKMLIF